jgi:hypothetical protein
LKRHGINVNLYQGLAPDSSISLIGDHVKILLDHIDNFKEIAALSAEQMKVLKQLDAILSIAGMEGPDDFIDEDKLFPMYYIETEDTFDGGCCYIDNVSTIVSDFVKLFDVKAFYYCSVSDSCEG